MPGQLRSVEEIREFAFAGNARLTLVSKRTGARFTFKIRKPSPEKPHFVTLFTGTDNMADYTFLGTIFQQGYYAHGSRSKIPVDAPAARAFEWFYLKLTKGELHPDVEVWHEGRCGKCGRPLTVPESIANGLGPECIKSIRRSQS